MSPANSNGVVLPGARDRVALSIVIGFSPPRSHLDRAVLHGLAVRGLKEHPDVLMYGGAIEVGGHASLGCPAHLFREYLQLVNGKLVADRIEPTIRFLQPIVPGQYGLHGLEKLGGWSR